MEKRSYRMILFGTLAAAFLLRLSLITSGGQYYWPDEQRYDGSCDAARALMSGDYRAVFVALHRADHFLYRIVGLFPAIIQIRYSDSPKVPAVFFSIFSVACLWLIGGIIRKFGGNDRESLFGVILLALSTSFLYYSRHLLPYDMSMAFGLFSLFAGLRRPARIRDSFLCGFFSLACFLTYNGYWIISGIALITHILRYPTPLDQLIKRALASGFSFIIPLVVILSASAVAGRDLIGQFIRFSYTISQGEFAEGWRLPFAYLWHSEHLITILWIAAFLMTIITIASRRSTEAQLIAFFAAVSIYIILVIFSVVLEKFVVYGRLVRQLVPFVTILSALFLEKLWVSNSKSRYMAISIIFIVLCQALWNFRKPVFQTFPSEFIKNAAEVSASYDSTEYSVLFAHHIDPEPKFIEDGGIAIVRKRHPLSFLPYQYEGYTPEQRSKLRSTDIDMRIIINDKL